MHCASQYSSEPLDAVAQLDLVFGLQFKMAGGWHARVGACSSTKRESKRYR